MATPPPHTEDADFAYALAHSMPSGIPFDPNA
jgi:hypothetical protein